MILSSVYILNKNGSFVTKDELYHYGIKGMKWGVRRYQNADGTLTAAGKKRISMQYKKTSYAAVKDLKKQYTNMYLKAYNKSVDYMNGGGIDKYNAEQRKKYGENFAKRDGYAEDYEKVFNKKLASNLNKSLNEFYKNNKNVAKGQDLVNKYGMASWDELAKSNTEKLEEVRRAAEDDE